MTTKRKRTESSDAHKNPQTNVRLSEPARLALDTLAERWAVPASKVVEMLLREKARAEGLRIDGLRK